MASQASSISYLERINDENKLLFLIDETMELLNKFDLNMFKARISLIKLTYLYYKNDLLYTKIKKRIETKGGDTVSQLKGIYFLEDSSSTIDEIVKLVIKYGQQKMRIKATLLQVYHLALHNNVSAAKDLLMKTHIGQIIID